MKTFFLIAFLICLSYCWVTQLEKLHEEQAIKIYRNGAFKKDEHFSIILGSLPKNKNTKDKFKELLRRAFHKFQSFDIKMDLRLYEEDSTMITKYEDLKPGKNYFLTVSRGEPFVYPSWSIGDEIRLKHVKDIDGNPLKLKIESQKPRIFSIDKLFSAEEIDALLEVGDCANWENSTQFSDDGKLYKNNARNSQSGWLEEECGAIVKVFNDRIESINQIYNQSESLQLLTYGPNQHYYRHYDAHPSTRFNTRNRFITFLLYLNDVEEGGHTAFPQATHLEDENLRVVANEDCNSGIKFKPKKGSAVMFYDLEIPNILEGNIDKFSSHIGCDVLKGYKVAANKWIWNKPTDWETNLKFN